MPLSATPSAAASLPNAACTRDLFLGSLLEFAPAAMFVYSLDGRYLLVNRAWERMNARSRDEVIGRPLTEVWDDAVARLFLDSGREALETGGPIYMEVEVDTPVGPTWLEITRFPLYDDEGKALAIGGIAVNATDRKRAERAQAEAEEKLRRHAADLETLLDMAPVAILTAHDPACKQMSGNRAAMELLRSPKPGMNLSARAGALNGPNRFRVYKDGRALPTSKLPMQIAARKAVAVNDTECDIRFEDGTRRILLSNAVPLLDADRKPRGSVGAFLDVTEREEQMAEIQSLNAHLRLAMLEAHHRIKNNLQLVCALLEMGRPDDGGTVSATLLDRISLQIRALAGLHDLITGQLVEGADADRLSAGALLEKLMVTLKPSAEPRALTYTFEEALLDSRRCRSLALIVNELVCNAVKHGAGEIRVAFRAAPGEATLEVCDDGPGFPPDFDPLMAVNTGLGIVMKLAPWDLGGEARFETRPEGGARAVLTFPLHSPHPAA